MAFGLYLRHEALFVGFFADDYAQLDMIEGHYPVARQPYDLFNFSNGTVAEATALQRTGFYPWWADPEARIRMLRPLASLMTWGDHALFGRRPLGHHMHSALWWLATLAAFAALLRRTLPATHAALAFGIVVCSIVQAAPLWWICNRSVCVASTFAILGLLAYMRYRTLGGRRWLAAATASYVIAFGFGEYAFCGLAYVFAYELIRVRTSNTRRRLTALGVVSAPAVLFVVARAAFRFDVEHSGVYIDPLGDPLEFLHAAVTRVPILVGDLLFVLPADYWVEGPAWLVDLRQRGWISNLWLLDPERWRRVHVAAGVVACVVAYLVVRFGLTRSRWRQISWLVAGGLLSILPVVGSFPSSRLLLMASIGFSALVAAVFLDACSALLQRTPASSWRTQIAAMAAIILFAHHLVTPSIIQRRAFSGIVEGSAAVRDTILNLQIHDEDLPNQHLVLLAAVEGSTSMYIPATRRTYGKSVPRSCHYLSYVRSPYLFTRNTSNSFTMRFAKQAPLLRTALEHLLRAPTRPIARNATVDVGLFRATVLELADGMPKQIRFEFDRSLDHRSLVLMVPEPQRFRRFELPEIGKTAWVPAPAVPRR